MIYSRILGKVSEGCWMYNDVGVYSDILNWVVKIALSLNSVVAVLCDIQS